MNICNPTDLFFDQLRDICSVESQVILTLPDLAERADSPSLHRWLLSHEERTAGQKKSVIAIFECHGKSPGGDICKAMKGLIDGGNEHLAKTCDTIVRDLLLVAHCNRIKHYEIAAYEFATDLAGSLGLSWEWQELSAILEEERKSIRVLTGIAAGLFGATT